MNWFIYSLLTMLLWGAADLFYKLGSDKDVAYSHLRTTVSVGIVMGAHALFTLVFGEISYNFINIIYYLPVSAMYILSMTVGYFGLRHLELSICSPVQNASGAVACLLCIVFLGQKPGVPMAAAIAVISLGMILLGVFEKKELSSDSQKYRIGFKAFFIPVAYCIIDALGTFFDAFYLDDYSSTPLKGATDETLEEIANTSYELTFFIIAVILSVYLFAFKKEKPFVRSSPSRLIAAGLETGGQFTYVFAMSEQAVLAAPMVAAYAIVSLLLSRIFIKEKLSLPQYICIFVILAGIVILGLYDA